MSGGNESMREPGPGPVQQADGRTSPLWYVIAVTLVLVVASVVIVIANSGKTQEFAANSPEDVVQQFVGAVLDGDDETARSLVVDDDTSWKTQGCGPVRAGGEADARVVHVRTEVSGSTATVAVVISQVRGFPIFGTDDSTTRDQFRLRRVDDSWKIDLIPWPFYSCGDMEVGP